MLFSSALFCWLIFTGAQPTPEIGNDLQFTGAAPTTWAGSSSVKASVVKDIWGNGAQSCQLNLKAMARTGGVAEVRALSGNQVFLKWMSVNPKATIGCPAGSNLFVVNTKSYQHMVTWLRSDQHLYIRE